MTLITERDAGIAVGLIAEVRTLRESFRGAVQYIARQHAEHQVLRVRYGHLLDEFRALRADTRRREAAQDARYARLLAEHRAVLNRLNTTTPATGRPQASGTYTKWNGHDQRSTHVRTA